MGVVPVADEEFVGIEAEFLAEEFGELRIAREDLVGRRMKNIWKERVETTHDRFGRFATKLLMRDRSQ